ncbi:MAG: NlpC/P60 family protein [Trichlorobacter sp.]|jgi:cell wall-associated NlpC family hydrolase
MSLTELSQKLLLFLLIWLLPVAAFAAPPIYAVANQPLAVYNTAQSAASGLPRKADNCGQVRELEFVALPGTPFLILNSIGQGQQTALEVTTSAYHPPSGVRLFVHPGGLSQLAEPAPPRQTSPPRPQELIRRLRSAAGVPYVWGGNLRAGIGIGEHQGVYAGLDCSGLLYEATDGFTPRNTADLVNYGQAVSIAGLRRDQLMKRLQPLDLLVWKGHVMIVLDNQQTIESVFWCGQPGNGGVRIAPLRQRLGEIMASRSGVDRWPAGSGKARFFVVRRWLP